MFEYAQNLVRYADLAFSVDFSRIANTGELVSSMQDKVARAFADMQALESGAIANPDEGRMVGHYWLRNAALAPNAELRALVEQPIAQIKDFAGKILRGELTAANGSKFTHVMVIGIGGSALGPQLVADALADKQALQPVFIDNTDSDGIVKTLSNTPLATTLSIVISKSGGTPETRNGMLEVAAAYAAAGLDFAKHAVAVTGVDSKLDQYAKAGGWLQRFAMEDWVGGRTSVMSVVGLLPAALQGVDIDSFLAGAARMDEYTRSLESGKNAAMLMALSWYKATEGRGAKDMVVLPYKDSLVLFSKYLQQLVMESLGKELDLDGNKVNQGIAVYGNKGSTDQHAYVQQLRDGVANFFAVFVEVRGAYATGVQVEPNTTSADFLQGFLRGTREALWSNARQSITISLGSVNATSLGALIALFERAVSFYASLVNINAYHQPGVEAGKKAAGEFLAMLAQVRGALGGQKQTAGELAAKISADSESVYHALVHIASNDAGVNWEWHDDAAADVFWRA